MPKAMRIALAVLIGFVVWFVVATFVNLPIRASLIGYAEAETAGRFTLPMLLARLAVGGLSSVAAGLACALFARSISVAGKVLAVALVLFFIPVHYALWAQFPLWYHAVFLISLAPLVLVGASVARHAASRGRGEA
jgi:hypothetical protein